VKTLFQFGDQHKQVGTVLCEWGSQYCCLAGFDTGDNKINWLTYKTYDILNDSTIEAVLDEVRNIGTVVVAASFPESVLTPLGQEGELILQQLYNPTQPVVALFDNINEWQVKNHYLVPKVIHNAFNDKFSNVSYINFFTAALKGHNGVMANDMITIHFSPNQFSVLVKKSGQLLLAQTYRYQAPLDVVYNLLKIVEEFHLSKEETELIISGLIEENSDLYKEVYQYFLNIHFAKSSVGTIEGNSFPHHFFTSIYNLATCVS